MKRTRETIFYSHPEATRGAREGLSGCHFHDGEDSDFAARNQRDRDNNKAAWAQQIEEKNQKKQIEREQDM